MKCLRINAADNVLVAIENIAKGEVVKYGDATYAALASIPAKHKVADREIIKGGSIVMYGVGVGQAVVKIKQGELITSRNIRFGAHDIKTSKKTYHWSPPDVSRWEGQTFNGYHRKDGKVGTANTWLVFPLVFCENRNIELLKESLVDPLGYRSSGSKTVNIEPLIEAFREGASEESIRTVDLETESASGKTNRIFQHIDGVKFLTHESGCGGTRADAKMFCELMAGYLTHPNVAGATVLSLGCENAQWDLLQKSLSKKDPGFSKPLYLVRQQDHERERSFISEAIKQTFAGLIKANQIIRRPASLSKLVLGLECGASDGFSGISANPALGYASDLLVAMGASSLLGEFPELSGVETALIGRCENKEIARRFIQLMKNYEMHVKKEGSGFEENPSAGNIREGLLTHAMKSAGAASKGGTAPIVDVLDHTETLIKNGLNLLCTPGNDVESTTSLVASGANVVAFTTGMGTPTGNPVAPVIKISSNSEIFEGMNDIIDLHAGPIIQGRASIEEKGREIVDFIVEVASGKKSTKAQVLGQDDFIPWKRDLSL